MQRLVYDYRFTSSLYACPNALRALSAVGCRRARFATDNGVHCNALTRLAIRWISQSPQRLLPAFAPHPHVDKADGDFGDLARSNSWAWDMLVFA